MNYYHIAGYILDLSNLPQDMIWERFDEFRCRESEPHISFEIMSEPQEVIYKVPDNAQRLMYDPVHMTYKYNGCTHLFHTPDDVVSYIKVNNDYSECLFNIEPAYFSHYTDPDTRESLCNMVMLEMRRILTGRLALDKGVCIHSCVIDYKGNGILFSAATKTGKSTHARLWQEVYPGTEVINGDNGFCRVLDGDPFVFSTPWCGDSNEYMNRSLPIKAIVFLEQAEENSVERLSALDAFLRLSARCYMPIWDKELANKAMDTVEYIIQKVSCYHLKCLPNRDAVKVLEHELFGK